MKKLETVLEDHTCQQCQGTGMIFFRMAIQYIKRKECKPWTKCDMCNGTGKHKLNALWFVWGAYITHWRTETQLTLRECSRKYKIDPSNLSKMERGIIKPDTALVQIACKYIYSGS